MGYWRQRPKQPPSVEHLLYFKIWAVANTISAVTLILILLCMIMYLTNHASNMAYLRYAVDSMSDRTTLINYPIKPKTNAAKPKLQKETAQRSPGKETIR